MRSFPPPALSGSGSTVGLAAQNKSPSQPGPSELPKLFRIYPKNAFWLNIFVGASFQILDIQQYACGLKLGPAARVPAKPLGEDGILNQNPIFEMDSNLTFRSMKYKYGCHLFLSSSFNSTGLFSAFDVLYKNASPFQGS
jgi:hypothetical protein